MQVVDRSLVFEGHIGVLATGGLGGAPGGGRRFLGMTSGFHQWRPLLGEPSRQ